MLVCSSNLLSSKRRSWQSKHLGILKEDLRTVFRYQKHCFRLFRSILKCVAFYDLHKHCLLYIVCLFNVRFWEFCFQLQVYLYYLDQHYVSPHHTIQGETYCFSLVVCLSARQSFRLSDCRAFVYQTSKVTILMCLFPFLCGNHI